MYEIMYERNWYLNYTQTIKITNTEKIFNWRRIQILRIIIQPLCSGSIVTPRLARHDNILNNLYHTNEEL